MQLSVVNVEVGGADDPRVKNPQKILSDNLTILLCVWTRLLWDPVVSDIIQFLGIVCRAVISYIDDQRLIKCTCQVCFLLPLYHVIELQAVALLFPFSVWMLQQCEMSKCRAQKKRLWGALRIIGSDSFSFWMRILTTGEDKCLPLKSMHWGNRIIHPDRVFGLLVSCFPPTPVYLEISNNFYFYNYFFI